MKFPLNKAYIYFFLLLTIGLFLSDTCFLLFGKPTPGDIPPMVSFDILYLLFIIILARKYIFILDWCNLPALELNENEMTYYVDNVRVKWSNVSAIRYRNIGRGYSIAVYVKGKKEVVRDKSAFFKIFCYLKSLISGTPVIISLLDIKGKNLDIFDKIGEYYKEISTKATISYGD